MKKYLYLVILAIFINGRFVFAKTYDLSQISSCNTISDYSEDTLTDFMDTVTFGSYPQSDVSGKTKEPIEWIVLDRQDDKCLLLSKCVLDCKCYNDTFKSTTWKECTLRKWLNSDFYNAAFNENEKSLVLDVDNTGNISNRINSISDEATNDRVFCLSYNELDKYFYRISRIFTELSLTSKATNYAKNKKNYGHYLYVNDSNNEHIKYQGCAQYWDRTIGANRYYAAYVLHNGAVDKDGLPVNYCGVGVRPAIWVSLGK